VVNEKNLAKQYKSLDYTFVDAEVGQCASKVGLVLDIDYAFLQFQQSQQSSCLAVIKYLYNLGSRSKRSNLLYPLLPVD
jgi:hypothetical protein